MARILYGVHGTGHGHAMRALTLARALPQHEFLFICNDDAPSVLEPEFKTARLPNIGTSFKNYRVDFPATIRKALPPILNRGKHISEALRIIDKFQPDVCMTDLEYFVPRAAEKTGLPCLTLDHQHILTCCRHDLPQDMAWDMAIQGLTPKWLFRPTAANLLISFYQPPVLPGRKAIVAPPILREKVLAAKPGNEGHVLVYQSNSTDRRLPEFLKSAIKDRVYIFGYRDFKGENGNLVYMEKSEDDFLRLLSEARYVIQGGSHTLMSEALYLGKPVISLPIKAMVEQRLNALYLEKLGYGISTDMASLNKNLLAQFLERLPEFRKNITGANFCGNRQVFGLVDEFAKKRGYPAAFANV